MVPYVPSKGRSLRENSPRTRERVTALDIITNHNGPVNTVTLLSPHTQQIRYLDLTENYWTDIQRSSEVTSGPLPLLRTLGIDVDVGLWAPSPMTPPSLPLFSNAVNLKEFVLHS